MNMYIESLVLKNFRNYEDEKFEFSEGINVITGMNAQGKTNCAEAVFYLCTGYSPRATRDKQVIRYGQDKAYISGNARTQYGAVNVELTFYPDKKNIRINGETRGCSGFVRYHGRIVYFTTERPCYGPLSDKFMYRKANSMQDLTGGTNQWCGNDKIALARDIARLLTNDRLW